VSPVSGDGSREIMQLDAEGGYLRWCYWSTKQEEELTAFVGLARSPRPRRPVSRGTLTRRF